MEVNLYHISFIVLVCITIVIGIYPKKAFVKNQTKEILSSRNKQVINYLEVSYLALIAYSFIDISSFNKILIGLALTVYLQMRLKR